MAYGLDVEEIYYTDSSKEDLGVLDTYHIQFDTADEKDFEMKTTEPVIPTHGLWYIPNTEYGGYVDGYHTDSDEQSVLYTGRTWRGLLASHYLDFGEATSRTFTTGTNEPQFDLDGTPANNITDVVNNLLAESNDDGWFVCDEPLVDESVSTQMTSCEITEGEEGATIYDAIIAIGDSIGFSFLFEYNPKDKKIHLTPILQQDYTDYLQYSNIATLGFQIDIDEMVTNHVIVSSEDENKKKRTIHLFADEYGNVQPYATVDNPIKDSQYILNKSKQVLFGVDEIADRIQANAAVKENYEAVTSAPANWQTAFGSYFQKEERNDEETGDVQVSYSAYSAQEATRETYTVLSSAPSDWSSNYASYYTRTYNPDYTSLDVYVVGSAPYERNWLSLKEGGSPLTPVENQLYRIAKTSGSFAIDTYYTWDGTEEQYEEAQGDRYNFSQVSPVTSLSRVQQVTKRPSDWNYHYTDYYYYVETGTGKELCQYEGKDQPHYVLMTKKPTDWDTNFSSYFRKVYKKVTYEQHKLKSGRLSNKKKIVKYVDCVTHKDAIHINCKADDDKKNGKVPSFYKRKHYRNDPITVPPEFNPKNTYVAKSTLSAPAFSANLYYRKTEEKYYDIPRFNPKNTYRQVLDHYEEMVKTGVQTLEESKKTNTQKMFLDDFDVNIGDTVGGRDEMTGTTIIGKVTNVNASIENGLLSAEYEVLVEIRRQGE